MKGNDFRKGIREFHKDFGDLLEKSKIHTLVVFIDDLDRCNPDTIIDILEAIRLFLFVERTAFVIGADERLVKYAVRRRFPEIPGERMEIGRDYLEKLIQFPVRIPQLSRNEIETYINLLFSSLVLDEMNFENLISEIFKRKKQSSFEVNFNYGLAKEILPSADLSRVEKDLSLSHQIAPILTTGLNGNPRQCKRFLNTLLMRINMANSKGIDLKKTILAKLMLLEYFKTESFKELAELQLAQEGCSRELKIMEMNVSSQSLERINSDSNKKHELSKELKPWVSDPWLVKWLRLEPKLAEIDLRPYFYYSRDTLGSFSALIQRMSPDAQELLNKLLSESAALRKNAVKSILRINEAEVSVIFDSLVKRISSLEDEEKKSSIFETIIEMAITRRDLLTQLFAVLSKMPEEILPINVVLKFQSAIKNTQMEAEGYKLIEKWSQSKSNKLLANAALKTLEKRR